MKHTFHERESFLAILAIGGLVAFLKEIVAGVRYLHALALTPHGAAALLVATFLVAAGTLVIAALRK